MRYVSKSRRGVLMAAIGALLSEVVFAVILFRHGRLDMMAGTIIDFLVYLFHLPGLAVTALFSLKSPTDDYLVYPFTVVSGATQFFVFYWFLIWIWSRKY